MKGWSGSTRWLVCGGVAGLIAVGAGWLAALAEGERGGCPCHGDLDGDGDVDVFDFGQWAPNFGCAGGGCIGDLDCDGDTDEADFVILCSQLGTSEPFDTVWCSGATGACCWGFDSYPGGAAVMCQETAVLACATLKGRFVGSGTTCTNSVCETTPVCRADLTGDNEVNVFDFSVFATAFGTNGRPAICDGDLDGDGFVTVLDFSVFVGDWGCSGPALLSHCCQSADPPE